DFEEAVKQLERAVELKPADPVIADHLGDAYWRVGRQLEARFQWQHAKDNKPEVADLVRIEKKLKSGLAEDTPVTPVDLHTNHTQRCSQPLSASSIDLCGKFILKFAAIHGYTACI